MPVIYQVRLQVIAAAEDDGSNAPDITAAAFNLFIPTLNQIYQKAGVKFLYHPRKDFLAINNTLISRALTLLEAPNLPFNQWDHEPVHDKDSHVQAREALARIFAGKLVIIYHNWMQVKQDSATGKWIYTKKTGGAAGWNGYYVDMSPESGAKDLAHELGHYLQINHTFWKSPANVSAAASLIKDYVEAGNPAQDGLLALDGDRDWVLDTPPDASLGIFKSLDLDPCGDVGEIDIPVTFANGTSQTYTLAPDRSLVMSYFKHCSGDKTISTQQARRVRDGLELRQRRDLISAEAGANLKIFQGASSSAGEVSEVAVALVHGGWVATAVRDGSGELKLIVWAVSASGNKISRLGTGDAGKVGGVSVCSLGLNMLATAVTNGSGILEVIAWRVTILGKPKKLGEASRPGGITEIACAYITRKHLITAVRLINGHLRLDVWEIPANGTVTHRASATAGKVNSGIPNAAGSSLAICEVGEDCVAISARDVNGRLKTSLWHYDVGSSTLTNVQNSTSGEPPVAAIAACSPGRENAVAAYQNQRGNLALQGYNFPEDAVTMRAAGSLEAGTVDSTSSDPIAICRLGVNMAVAGVRAGVGKLKLILWQTTPRLAGFARLDDFTTQESYSRLAIVQSGVRQFVTALRDSAGNLKLIAWHVKLVAGKAPPLGAGTVKTLPLDAALGGECDAEEEPTLVKVGRMQPG